MEGCATDRDECSKGPCPHGLFGPTQSVHFGVHGDAQGQIGDQALQDLSEPQAKALLGQSFLVKGLFVSTVGLDEQLIRRYVKYQEHH